MKKIIAEDKYGWPIEVVAEAQTKKAATQPAGEREHSNVLRFSYDVLGWRQFGGKARITVKVDEAALEQLKSEVFAQSNAEIEKLKRNLKGEDDAYLEDFTRKEIARSKAEVESLDVEIRRKAAKVPLIRLTGDGRIDIQNQPRCQQVFLNGKLVSKGDDNIFDKIDHQFDLEPIHSDDPHDEKWDGSNF